MLLTLIKFLFKCITISEMQKMCQYLLIQNKKVYTDLMFDGKEKKLLYCTDIQDMFRCSQHNFTINFVYK